MRDNRFVLVTERLLAWQSARRRSWYWRWRRLLYWPAMSYPQTRAAQAIRRWRDGGAPASSVPLRWLRRPALAAGERVCLFALLPRGGAPLPHSLDHLAAWRAAGYKVIVVVAVAALDEPLDLASLAAADGLAVRLNRGYDFGAWAAAIRALGRPIHHLGTLALANDSVLGPSDRFAAMLARAERSDADVIGLVETHQIRRHLQSFVLFFRPRALRARAFRRFWRGVRSGDRQYVIDFYEIALQSVFAGAGLRCAALFEAGTADAANPTLTGWRALVDAGMPYIKVQLLRDNPVTVPLTDWRGVAAAAGFDLDRLDRQIAALKRHGSARWSV